MEQKESKKFKMVKAECPACSAKVELGAKPRLGQRVVCRECDAELEVVWLDPVELDWPYDEDEYDDELEGDFDDD